MDKFIKNIIEETFKSNKPRRYTHTKVNDKSLPNKTNFENSDREVNEDYEKIEGEKPYYYTGIAFINIKRRIKENLDSIFEVQEFASKMAHEKHAEALQIDKFDEKGHVKRSFFIYNREDGKWGKVPSLPYHEFQNGESDIDEIVDEKGNIQRKKIPTTRERGGASTKTTDQVMKTAAGFMGNHGIASNKTSRYWGESDMSKSLGFEKTMGQDADIEDAEEYFTDELGLNDDEAEERMNSYGYDEKLGKEKVRLVENPKKFISDYVESIVTKRTDFDLVKKDQTEDVDKELNPIIKRQITALKNTLTKNNLSVKDVIKLLKKEDE